MAKKTKKTIPAELFAISDASLYDFQESAEIDAFMVNMGPHVYFAPGAGYRTVGNGKTYFTVNPDGSFKYLEKEPAGNVFPLPVNARRGDQEKTILYVTETGDCWTTKFSAEWNHDIDILKSLEDFKLMARRQNCVKLSLSPKWENVTKFMLYDVAIQGKERLMEIMQEVYPYMFNYVFSNGYDYGAFLICPFLEVLLKAGYKFAEPFAEARTDKYPYYVRHQPQSADITKFNTLCKPGKNPKEIFNVPPAVFTALKDTRHIKVWDELRKLNKKIDTNAVKRLAEMDFQKENIDVRLISSILKQTYNDKPVFTLDSLLKYLDRVDVYEAINRFAALPLIDDYLHMCKTIGKKPCITGDSLKREHDVTARMSRQYRNESFADGIKEMGEKLLPFTYKEENFFIRPIKDYDALIDEGTQQGNCLAAAYPALIASGKRFIFVMRSTAEPNKSLATIELYDDFTLGQHLLSFNRVMKNQAQLSFLKRWMKHVAEVKNRIDKLKKAV